MHIIYLQRSTVNSVAIRSVGQKIFFQIRQKTQASHDNTYPADVPKFQVPTSVDFSFALHSVWQANCLFSGTCLSNEIPGLKKCPANLATLTNNTHRLSNRLIHKTTDLNGQR